MFQFTEEKLGSAEKTELDAHFENLVNRAEKTRVWTDKTLKATEALLQPNPSRNTILFCLVYKICWFYYLHYIRIYFYPIQKT